jgi:hypothetical protein
MKTQMTTQITRPEDNVLYMTKYDKTDDKIDDIPNDNIRSYAQITTQKTKNKDNPDDNLDNTQMITLR